MKRSSRLSPVALLGATFCALTIVGCAQEGATPLTTSGKPAPPPASMTPEQKKAYEEGVKNAGPPMADAK